MCELKEAFGEINSMGLANCDAFLGIIAMFETVLNMV